MKFNYLKFIRAQCTVILSLVTAITIGNLTHLSLSVQAQTNKTRFVCGQFEGKPTTIAKIKTGNVPVVIWNSETFSESGFTPQVRCQKVSAKFQTLYQNGGLKYITAGTIDRLPVLCGTKQFNGACNRQNLLYTLKPNANPQQVIKNLMRISNQTTSRGLEERDTTVDDSTPINSIELNWLEED
jgi:hypothetical protein